MGLDCVLFCLWTVFKRIYLDLRVQWFPEDIRISFILQWIEFKIREVNKLLTMGLIKETVDVWESMECKWILIYSFMCLFIQEVFTKLFPWVRLGYTVSKRDMVCLLKELRVHLEKQIIKEEHNSGGGGQWEDMISGWPKSWTGQLEVPHLLPCPWDVCSAHCSHSGSCFQFGTHMALYGWHILGIINMQYKRFHFKCTVWWVLIINNLIKI